MLSLTSLVRYLKRVPPIQVIIEEEPWELEDPYFALGFGGVNWEQIKEDEKCHQERIDRIYERWIAGQAERKALRAEYGELERTPREARDEFYTFEDRTGPMPPYSAVLVPRPLTRIEQEALAIADLLEGVQVKGVLKKKVKDLKKGPRRVIVQPNGKLKEVKGA